MPFAMIGFFIGLHEFGLDRFNYKLLLLVIVCMVTARNAAMAFNRWADYSIDKKILEPHQEKYQQELFHRIQL